MQFLGEKRGIYLRAMLRTLLSAAFLAFIFFHAVLLQTAHAASFDAWQSGFVVNTDYTAATDGFVVARVGGSGDKTCDTDLQTGGVSRQYGTANNDGSQQSMVMPVRKGELWRVWSVKAEYKIGGDCPRNIYWIPVSTGLFGAWQSGFGVNTNYTAATDGFVVARIYGRDIDVNCTTDLQTEGVSRQWENPNKDGSQQSMMMPVRKGASWRVGDTDPGACIPTVYWIPAVTDFLGAWQSGFGVNTNYTAATDGFAVARVGEGGNVTCTTDLQTAGVSRQLGNANNDGAQQSMMTPVRKGDSWMVGSIGRCARNVYWIPFLAPALPAPTLGTIIEKAALDGQPWDSPPFTIAYDAPYGANQTATLDLPQTFTNMQTGTYTVKGVTPPAGVTLQNINGSSLPYSATLSAGGTITVTYNFITTPPPTGTIIQKATLDGQPWDSPPFTENYTGPNGTFTISLDIALPDTKFFNMPSGAWSVNWVTPPPGYTLQNVNGSSLPYNITLPPGGTITVTYNFVTIVVPPPVVPTFVVSSTSASVQVGGTQQFNAIYDPDGSGPQYPLYVTNSSFWSSSNNSVATINSIGSAVGVSAGSVTITARYSGLTASASLVVTAPVLVPTFAVISSSASIAIGGANQFNAIYDPDGLGPNPSQDVTAIAAWSSSDASKVTISGGLAARVGHGLILISASYSGLSDSSDVLDPATFRVLPLSATMNVGDTIQLSAMFDPDGSVGSQAEQNVTASANWSSNRPYVASVDNSSSKGLVSAVASGRANISAIYNGLAVTGRARITVVASSQCSDGIDNDGDGRVDMSDPGCSSPNDNDETDLSQCSDGIDNDGDGRVDMSDPGCSSPNDNDETDLSQCSDGIDNDGDGRVDMSDPGCSSPNDNDEANAPETPSNLRIDAASLNTCGVIRLIWSDVLNESRYEVERNSGSGFTLIGTPVANDTDFSDDTVAQNTAYVYRVRACNAFGCSAYSNVATGNNQSPSVNFNWAPLESQVNRPTLFTDISLAYGGVSITTRAWTFQNGNPATKTTSAATTSAKFLNVTPVQKAVTLRVTDSSSRMCSATKNVTVTAGDDLPDWEEEPPE